MENQNLCNGCSGLKTELWPKDKQAARCMAHPGSWGYGRTLTVAEQGYIGRVYRPAWCMGKEGGEENGDIS